MTIDSARDKTYLDRANDLEQLMQRDPMGMLGKGTKIEVKDWDYERDEMFEQETNRMIEERGDMEELERDNFLDK